MTLRAFPLALAALFAFSLGAAQSEPVLLKSGERGEMTFGVTSPVVGDSGTASGNRLHIEVRVTDRLPARPELQARLLCQKHALTLYRQAVSLDHAAAFIDSRLPLTETRVTLLTETNGVAAGPYYAFDMVGIAKCRPL